MKNALRNRKPGKVRWWMVVLLSAIILLVYMAIPRPVEVRTARVSRGSLLLELSTTGVVEGELSDISPRMTARIIALYAEENQPVAAGQALCRLEDADIRAEAARMEAAVRAAGNEAAALRQTAESEAGQLDAAVNRARASLRAAQHRLRDLQSGAFPEDIAAQRATLAQVRTQAEDTRRRYERAEQLYKAGAISAQDRDAARTAYRVASSAVETQQQILRRLEAGPRNEAVESARAEVEAAQAALREAEAAQGLSLARERQAAAAEARRDEAAAGLSNAHAQLEYTVLRSPVNGVVVRKHKEVGETATPLDPVYTVADLNKIWITAEVDESDIAALAMNQRVRITQDAYPGKSISGRVTRILQVAEPKEVGRVRAKVVRARIEFDETIIPLRPGMEVNINGSVPAQRRTLLAPNDAVTREGDREQVVIVNGGIARRRFVRTGQANFDFTEVLSGLREGDIVATTNLDMLSDGTRVRIVR